MEVRERMQKGRGKIKYQKCEMKEEKENTGNNAKENRKIRTNK